MGWEWAPPIATLTAGSLAVGGAVVVARYNDRRHGRWESIKTDLEIAALLNADDPMAKWLRDYADVRLKAYGASETKGKTLRYWRTMILLCALASVFLFGLLGRLLIQGPEGASDWLYIGALVALLAYGVPLTVVTYREQRDNRVFALRGVRGVNLTPLNAEVEQLHGRVAPDREIDHSGD